MFLEDEAILLGSSELEDYPIDSYYWNVIDSLGADNIGILGNGIIDG